MPSKKKKYNTRFPASRIKKIMQTDEEIGKVAQAVPIIISRTLELFVESLLRQSMQITQSRNAKTLTPSHMKQCILAERRFDFLKDLVKNVPDASVQEDNENNAIECAEALDYSMTKEEPKTNIPELPAANYYTEQQQEPSNSSAISARTPVIQFTPKYTDLATVANDIQASPKTYATRNKSHNTQPHTIVAPPPPKINFSIDHLVNTSNSKAATTSNSSSTNKNLPPQPTSSSSAAVTPHLHLDFSHLSASTLSSSEEDAHRIVPTIRMTNHIIAASPSSSSSYTKSNDDSGSGLGATTAFSFPMPPLAPLPQSHTIQPPNAGDSLYIDEDYDN